MVDVFTVNGDNNLMETSSRFITIEGAEGVGKSTCIAVVESWLEGQGLSYVSTREPGGTPLGEKLRALLLDPASVCVARSTCERSHQTGAGAWPMGRL